MLGAFFMSFKSVKCYGSTSVSKTEGRGSTPCTDAKYVSVAEWLRKGLQIPSMQVRVLSLTPKLEDIRFLVLGRIVCIEIQEYQI